MKPKNNDIRTVARGSITSLCLSIALSMPILCFGQAAEKQVTFYHAYGYLEDNLWNIPLKIWVYEKPDFARRLAARAARSQIQKHAELENLTAEQIAYFDSRAHDFIADSESREVVDIEFDGDVDEIAYRIKDENGRARTDRNGLAAGTIQLTAEKAAFLLQAQESEDGWLSFRVVSKDHEGMGRIRLISPTGISIVSDIDDTIKVTNIPLGEVEVLRNTFFREFTSAPCMAAQYSSMARGTAFHYVSGGPWQLYSPLETYLFSEDGGFPVGSVHMKDVRTNPFEGDSYRDISNLVANGSQQVTFEQKIRQITELLERFPEREFVLVGDSGEKDPEVFAYVRTVFPDRDIRVYVRDVVNAATDAPHRLANMQIISPNPDNDADCRIR